MSAGGGTQQTLRRAFGALKDSTTVGLVKVNSENKGLDVAIVKATNHDEVFPKEKHVMTIFNALSSSRTRADVAYCINGLTKRLAKTHNWTVALKTLVVIHRAVREVDHTFHEELVNYSRGARLMFNLSHFRDDSSPSAWDCSAWVRAYALYLEERLECFRLLKYDLHKNHSRAKKLDTPELLEQLPAMQQLLFRLLACKPEGMAAHNGLVHYALSIVASESVKLYVAITDGILNMVDKYFEMERHDAVRALEIYKKGASQGEKLSEFFEMCRSLDFGKRQKYIKIEQPPESFLTAMEEYVAEAPHVLALEWIQISEDECGTPKEVPAPQAVLLIEYKRDDQEKANQRVTSSETLNRNQSEGAATSPVADLLGFDEFTQAASELDEKSSLALSILQSDNSVNMETAINSTSQNTNWELALVTAPSSNGAAVAASKMAGGLDKPTLDSLYDNAMVKEVDQNGTFQTRQVALNPFNSFHNIQESFHTSSDIAPATNFQMVASGQEQALLMIQQQKTNIVGFDSSNPFGNPFVDENIPNSFDVENVPLHWPQSSNYSLI